MARGKLTCPPHLVNKKMGGEMQVQMNEEDREIFSAFEAVSCLSFLSRGYFSKFVGSLLFFVIC